VRWQTSAPRLRALERHQTVADEIAVPLEEDKGTPESVKLRLSTLPEAIVERFKTRNLSFSPASRKRRDANVVAGFDSWKQMRDDSYNFEMRSNVPLAPVILDPEERIPTENELRKALFYRDMLNFPVLRRHPPEVPKLLARKDVDDVLKRYKERISAIRSHISSAKILTETMTHEGTRRRSDKLEAEIEKYRRIPKDRNMISTLRRIMKTPADIESIRSTIFPHERSRRLPSP
jgi:hypothetical protein